MGNVVEMNAPARRKRRSSRTALVLGGGGFTGGVYQIGALRALDLLSSNRSVNQFDIYVGTSAGSLIASLVANGVTPEQMMRTVNDQVPHSLPPLDREMLLRLNKAEFALKALKLPLHAISVARNVAASLGSLSAVDLVLALGDALPSGIYTGEGVEDYVRKALSAEGRTDDFRLLERELYLAATDLDTCERIVLGAEGWDDIPISAAVRASTALPMIYAPYRVRDRELVDGGIVSTTNLDIAVEAGAKFIVVVNPLVPVRQRLLEDDPDAVRHPRAPRLGHGLPEDRLPDVQAARLPAPARDGLATGRSATRASTSS